MVILMNTKGKRFAEKTSKPKKNNKIVYNFIIFICLIVMGFSLYKIINWAIENNKNKSMLDELQSSITITHEEIVVDDHPIVKTNYDFTNLLQKNPRTVGWIYVPNTNIDYPIVQADNNEYYLDHSFDNSPNSAGWVFADYEYKPNVSKNAIIYGHNRKDWSMFGSLKSVFEDDWRNNIDNNYITFATLDGTNIYKIFSAFVVNDENANSYLQSDFSSDEQFKAYLNKLKKTSTYEFDTDIENAEEMVTLYTCYGMNNQRLLVFAAKVY